MVTDQPSTSTQRKFTVKEAADLIGLESKLILLWIERGDLTPAHPARGKGGRHELDFRNLAELLILAYCRGLGLSFEAAQEFLAILEVFKDLEQVGWRAIIVRQWDGKVTIHSEGAEAERAGGPQFVAIRVPLWSLLDFLRLRLAVADGLSEDAALRFGAIERDSADRAAARYHKALLACYEEVRRDNHQEGNDGDTGAEADFAGGREHDHVPVREENPVAVESGRASGAEVRARVET